MKLKLAHWSALSLLLIASSGAADSLVDGDADAGKARAITCNACHGADGNSASPLWPNLAGQNAPYTISQLQAFKNSMSADENVKKSGRSDSLMSSQALALSDTDMANLAVYFESLPRAAQTIGAVEGMSVSEVLSRGESLYRGGDKEDKTSACIACHGPSGAGNPAAEYPALSGQHAAYTAKQLRDYRSGTRTTDGTTRMMRDIAATLNDEDIEALSAYIQGLH